MGEVPEYDVRRERELCSSGGVTPGIGESRSIHDSNDESSLFVLQLVQQRNAQEELESQRRQTQELAQTKAKLQAELANLQDKLEREQRAKNEESSRH